MVGGSGLSYRVGAYENAVGGGGATIQVLGALVVEVVFAEFGQTGPL